MRVLWTSLKENIHQVVADLTEGQTTCPEQDNVEVAKLKARLEKTRDELDDAKEEVQKEKDRRVEYRQRNHALNTALQRAHKELEAMRLQKSLQVTAEDSQNLKAYHESEKAREALQLRVAELTVQLEAGLSNTEVVEKLERADLCTATERAVLNAMGKVPESWLRWFMQSAGCWNVEEFRVLGEAEIANRAAGIQQTPQQDTAQQKLDDIQEIVLRYDGCPAEDYADAWWEVRQQVKGWTQPGT